MLTNDHVTRPYHFIWPILFILLGGYVMTWTGDVWLWAGIGIWVVATFQSFWLMISGMLRETINYIRERAIVLEPEPVETTAKDTVKVVIDHYTDSNSYNTSYRYLSIAPDKMKVIAQACLNGTPFSIRVWSGNGKLLSDPEFRILKDELLDLGFLVPRNEKDDRQGYTWTDLGTQMLRECVEDAVPK
jgi:hypothetical protein